MISCEDSHDLPDIRIITMVKDKCVVTSGGNLIQYSYIEFPRSNTIKLNLYQCSYKLS